MDLPLHFLTMLKVFLLLKISKNQIIFQEKIIKLVKQLKFLLDMFNQIKEKYG